MINIPRWEQRLDSYHKALARLAEIVGASKKRALNEFERDGLVQRFEFTQTLVETHEGICRVSRLRRHRRLARRYTQSLRNEPYKRRAVVDGHDKES